MRTRSHAHLHMHVEHAVVGHEPVDDGEDAGLEVGPVEAGRLVEDLLQNTQL